MYGIVNCNVAAAIREKAFNKLLRRKKKFRLIQFPRVDEPRSSAAPRIVAFDTWKESEGGYGDRCQRGAAVRRRIRYHVTDPARV